MAAHESEGEAINITEIPEAARCPEGKDCTLLTDQSSYRSQIVRLAAEEKGINYGHFKMDITRKLTQFEPWYIQLNESAYVPTMLVGPECQPVCESIDIIKYIEANFEGKEGRKLQAAVEANPMYQERFDQLIALHEGWDVDAFTYGTFNENYFLRFSICATTKRVIRRTLIKRKKNPKLEHLYDQKLIAKRQAIDRTILRIAETMPEECKKAKEVLVLVDGWMTDGADGPSFALGTDEYTLADVVFSCMLVRLHSNADFFRTQVDTRPKLRQYWDKHVKGRRSFKTAHLAVAQPPSNIGTFLFLVIFLAFVTAFVMGGLYFFRNYSGMTWSNLYKYVLALWFSFAIVGFLMTYYAKKNLEDFCKLVDKKTAGCTNDSLDSHAQ